MANEKSLRRQSREASRIDDCDLRLGIRLIESNARDQNFSPLYSNWISKSNIGRASIRIPLFNIDLSSLGITIISDREHLCAG